MTGQRTLPNLGLTNRWTGGSDGWGDQMDADLAMLDALLHLAVVSATQAAPPASPAPGDRYIVAAGGTGAWAGHDAAVAVYADGGWTFYAPRLGWRAYVADQDADCRYKGTAWAAIAAPSAGTTGTGATGTTGGTAATTHRYWQILITSGQDAYSLYQMAEVQFRTVAGTALAFSGGVASASSELNTAAYSAGAAADSNPGSFWSSANKAPPNYWRYAYAAGAGIDVAEVLIQTRGDDGADGAPFTFDLQWSDDGTAWTTRKSFTAAPWTTLGQVQTFRVAAPSTVPHRFWRIYQPANNGAFAFSEVQFRATAGVSSPFASGTPTAANYFIGNPASEYAPAQAADGNTATRYSNTNNAVENWWQWDYGAGAGTAVREVTIQARNDSQYGDAPRNVAIQCSDDGTTWTTRASFPSVAWSGPGQTQVFAVPAA